MNTRPLLIRGARILDPAAGRDERGELFIVNGCFAHRPDSLPADIELFPAEGLVAAPGFIDLHVHLREPGNEEAETIESGCRAAARGGFTTVVAMPNTRPPLDVPERISEVAKRGKEIGLTSVLPTGCITRDRAGRELAPLTQLAEAGACAFTDDGSTVTSEDLMRRAMRVAASLRRPIFDHAQDAAREAGGLMHEGEWSRKWGLPGIPSAAEHEIVERDIRLSAETGCRVHIQHVSARESVALIRRARAAGLPVSAEVTPHHLALTDADVRPDDARWKMNPPLRSAEDRAALREALAQGVITALATDHAPHTAAAKGRGFAAAPFGVVGLETAVGVTYTELVVAGHLDWATWVRRWTVGPAEILGLPVPTLAPGAVADLVLLDLNSEWTVSAADFHSKARNTPFEGRVLRGRAVCTIHQGRIVFSARLSHEHN